MKELNLKTGRLGEDIAKEYLEDKGYKIIDQNYKTKYAEIDIIAERKNVLIFVEVRTKTGEQFGTPEDTLTKAKLAKIKRNAIAYSSAKRWEGPCRIDAVCVVLNPDKTVLRLSHYENITM